MLLTGSPCVSLHLFLSQLIIDLPTPICKRLNLAFKVSRLRASLKHVSLLLNRERNFAEANHTVNADDAGAYVNRTEELLRELGKFGLWRMWATIH